MRIRASNCLCQYDTDVPSIYRTAFMNNNTSEVRRGKQLGKLFVRNKHDMGACKNSEHKIWTVRNIWIVKIWNTKYCRMVYKNPEYQIFITVKVWTIIICRDRKDLDFKMS